jgi:hypothetical protein
MKSYEKGDFFQDKDNDFKTYGITEIDSEMRPQMPHTNKIEIYGDKKLRDKIIRLLNKDEKKRNHGLKDKQKILDKDKDKNDNRNHSN